LLIADNYVALKELFQAKATLNSIIDKSENPDVKSQAMDRLEQIKSGELLDTLKAVDE
jgi:hypothetical protein